jgi:DNA-binding NarL/FixJ family response regulator
MVAFIMPKIKVLLADDHAIVRQGFKSLLTAQADIEIICEACDGRQAVQMARKLQPDVIVMDIVMPLMNGLEATRQILKLRPDARILILSSYSDEEYVQRFIELGATGYLIKSTASGDLLNAIRGAHVGKAFFSPSIARALDAASMNAFARGISSRKQKGLTSRETEVLQLIAEGYANKQIAAELGISIKTVEKHRQQLMDKLQLHDVASLTRHALAKGVIHGHITGNLLLAGPDPAGNSPPQAEDC